MLFDSTILKKLSHHAKSSFTEAERIATSYQCEAVLPIHLLIAIYLERGSLGSILLKDAGVTEHSYASFLLKKKSTQKKDHAIQLSDPIKEVLTRAYHLASETHFSYVGTEHLVYALLESTDPAIKDTLTSIKLKKKVAGPFSDPKKKRSIPHLPNPSQLLDAQNINIGTVGESEEDSSYLEQFCINLQDTTQKNRDTLIGRDQEIERLIHILGRKTKNNAILIGEPGVGKTALVSGLAQRIQNGNVPTTLIDKKIYELDMALVIAGTSFRGEFENRLKEIIQEIQDDPNIILFIDEIHSVVGAGNTNGSLDAANILKPALSRGDLRCIGATTFTEYKKFIEKDPALERRFQPIQLQEPSVKETVKILKGLRASYEQFHQISIAPEAIDASVELSTRYIPERFLPDKALDILDETASAKNSISKKPEHLIKKQILEKELERLLKEKEVLIQNEQYEEASQLRKDEEALIQRIKKINLKKTRRSDLPQITSHDIAQTISRTSGIPIETIQNTAHKKIRELHKDLSREVIGQADALQKMTSILTRSFMGLARDDRPLGSFLLMGPTGVGKTYTAKILAEKLFQTPNSLIRINMSELRERHSIASLVGAPAGYVGYGEGGKFTEKVRRQPYSVILFDEIEKAHPDVLNILLQVLEEGELVDAEGRRISFSNTIILLTANIGSREIVDAQNSFGFTQGSETSQPSFKALEEKLKKELSLHVRPEILGRLDETLIFQPLQEKDIQIIAKKEIEKTKQSLKKNNITLHVPPVIIKRIAKKSLKGPHGARHIRKHIHELLENTVADTLLHAKKTPKKLTAKLHKDSIIIE